MTFKIKRLKVGGHFNLSLLAKNYKVLREPGKRTDAHFNSRSPDSKGSMVHYTGGSSGKPRSRLNKEPLSIQTLSTSKRIETQFAKSDLYNKIVKSPKGK